MELSNKVFGVQVSVFFDNTIATPILKLATAIQEEYRAVFTGMPHMVPLPDDAPKEVPRCVFQKPDQSATIAISLARMDYKAGIKIGVDWRNHMGIVVGSFIRICATCGAPIERIGLVVETQGDDQLVSSLTNKISFEDFKNCREKNISWVNQKNILSNIKTNVFTNIQINLDNILNPMYISVDANTHANAYLSKNPDILIQIANSLFDEIEEKMHELF